MKRDNAKKQSLLAKSVRHRRLPRAIFAVVLGLVAVMAFSSPKVVSASTSNPNPTIRVEVNNYSQASRNVLAGAEREATRIFSAAGLEVVWLDCPPAHAAATQDSCQRMLEATDIRLRVLPSPIRNNFQDTVFGFAVRPVLASVYYDFVLRLAKNDNAEFELPIILGTIVAHEIGHLLLGSNSHTAVGIMQPQWGPNLIRQAMMGTLVFTHEQAELIQADAQNRTRLRKASLEEMPIGAVER
jgi:hypothetical protein